MTTPTPIPRRYLSAAAAAEYICHSAGTLANWRASGQGPAYLKVHHRVLYDIAALDEWIASLNSAAA